MCISTGVLFYSDNPVKLILQVDSEIGRYYKSLIPKYISCNKQKFQTHISVVRKVIPPNMQFWNKYQGKSVEFEYDNEIHFCETYFWINAFSTELEFIRSELGLPLGSKIKAPHGFMHTFHITLGNRKYL